MTEFAFENLFRAPSTAAMLAAYFEPAHLAAQDEVAGLIDRTVIDDKDDGSIRECSWKVAAKKQLPLFVRPFVAGGRLRYVEWMRWRRADDAVDMTIKPEVLGGRVSIDAVYQLTKVGEGQVKRRYAGKVTVDVRLVSGKIERAIVSEIEAGMPMMTKCTQDWLDRTINQHQ